MAGKVAFKPEGYHTLTPYVVVKDCSKAIDFYKKVFSAEETLRMPTPDGKVAHAELKIGDSILMLADSTSEFPTSSAAMMLYLQDCDAVFKKAVDNGATVLQPLENKFYGDRSGTVKDPFGQQWSISTHVEDVPPEEMEKRAKQAMGG